MLGLRVTMERNVRKKGDGKAMESAYNFPPLWMATLIMARTKGQPEVRWWPELWRSAYTCSFVDSRTSSNGDVERAFIRVRKLSSSLSVPYAAL